MESSTPSQSQNTTIHKKIYQEDPKKNAASQSWWQQFLETIGEEKAFIKLS